ncbi:MAG TPA: hypothetical protein VIE90_15085 [Candidatus Binatia bacterium]|jgi:hypothetical protein
MFVENYRRENAESIMAGGEAAQPPYPRISAEDWRVWTTFLPIRSHNLDRRAAANFSTTSLHEGIPSQVATEVQRASQHFDKVEIWRKNQIEKDPIAVGVLGQERYMIARWGMEKLIPFEAIKKSMPLVLAWKYATSPLAVMVELAGASLLAWNLIVG